MMTTMKEMTNTILTGVGAAMGIAVCVLPIVDPGVATRDLVSLLGVGIAAFGLLALKRLHEK